MSTIREDGVPLRIWAANAPIQGMVTARPQRAGEFADVREFRTDTGLPVIRLGITNVLARPTWASSALPLGRKQVNLNGEQYIAGAWKDGTKVRVALATATAAGVWRWVDLTGEGSNQWGGASGDPRLTNVSVPVNFEVIKTPRYLRSSTIQASKDLLVVTNQEDDVLIFDRLKLTESRNINGATNASPIEITTTANHDLETGDAVWIANVAGNTGANGLWNIVKTSATKFTLTGSTGTGAYTAGGTVGVPFLGTHKKVTVPDGGASPSQYAFLSQFLGVATASGITRTYAVAGVKNQARFRMQDSTVAPYSGGNVTQECTIGTTVAANDIATTQYSSSMGCLGKHLYFIVEGAYVPAFFRACKLEINQDNVADAAIASAWVEIYSPTSGDNLRKNIIFKLIDAINNRWMVGIPLTQVSQTAGNRISYHMRFTWLGNTPAPGSTQTITFLMIANASALSTYDAGFPGGSLWECSYEDNYSWAESPIYTPPPDALDITQMGGPPTVKNGTDTAAAPKLPIFTDFFYDYRLVARNSDGATAISGGLDGEPSQLNWYLRLPGATKSYFAFEQSIYTPGLSGATRQWAKTSSSLNITKETNALSFFIREYANSNREAPSEFQLVIPKCFALCYDNGRLICGNTKDEDGTYSYGDVYVSWDRYPMRFTQVQEDERQGSFFQIAQEKVQSIKATSSAFLGAGRVFIHTDRSVGSVGDPSPYSQRVGSASDLSRYVKIGPHGTLSPMSVCEGYNQLAWQDQDGQWMRLAGSGPENFAKYKFHDLLEAIPISRRDRVAAAFFKDRFYMGHTPSGGTNNTRVFVYNSRMDALEATDRPAFNFEMPFIYQPSVSGATNGRLMFFHTDGSLRAYEENVTDDDGTPLAPHIATGFIEQDGWNVWFIEEAQATASQNSGDNLTVNRISRKWGDTEPWRTTLSVDETGASYATYRDTEAHVKVGADRGIEEDSAWAVDVDATGLAPGSTIKRFEILAVGEDVSAGKR